MMKKVGETEYEFKWFSGPPGATSASSMLEEQKGKSDPIKLTVENIVHVFDKLVGCKNRKTKGKIPAEELKVIKQVLLAGKDAVDNHECSCVECGTDFVDDDETLRCEGCSIWVHPRCANPPLIGGEGSWWCKQCQDKVETGIQ